MIINNDSEKQAKVKNNSEESDITHEEILINSTGNQAVRLRTGATQND